MFIKTVASKKFKRRSTALLKYKAMIKAPMRIRLQNNPDGIIEPVVATQRDRLELFHISSRHSGGIIRIELQ